MANVVYQLPRPGSAAKVQYIVGDAAASLPASVEGSIAYAKDTDLIYAYSGSAWVAVGAGGSNHNILSGTHSDSFSTDTPSNGDVLTWVAANSRWEAAAAGAGSAVAVEMDDTSLDSATTTLDFEGDDFYVTVASHEAEIQLSRFRQVQLLGNIAAWFMAERSIAIADVETPSDGEEIAIAWDISQARPNGAAAWVSSKGPLYKPTSGPNSKPTMRFNGTDESMTAPDSDAFSPSTTAGITVFVVANADTQNSSDCMVGKGGSGWEWQFNSNVSGVGGPTLTTYQSGGASNNSVTYGSVISAATNYIFAFRVFNGIEIKVWRNGGAGVADTTFTGSMTNSGDALYIGQRGDSSQYFDGDIAEVIVFGRALSHADMDIVHNYLNAKYGISVTACS